MLAREQTSGSGKELEGKVVCLVTGMHRLFDDTKEYYHYSCGTGREAGEWFVDHKVKCVAMDMQALDHPLHTAMGNNGMTRMNLLGASGNPITEEYKELCSAKKLMQDLTNSSTSKSMARKHMTKFGALERDRLLGNMGAMPQDNAWSWYRWC